MTLLLAILFLIMAVGCYSISQLQQHGQLKWGKEGTGFWGYDSDKRKYFSKIPLAKTWLVFLTDGYWWIFGGVMIKIRLINWLTRKLFSK